MGSWWLDLVAFVTVPEMNLVSDQVRHVTIVMENESAIIRYNSVVDSFGPIFHLVPFYLKWV